MAQQNSTTVPALDVIDRWLNEPVREIEEVHGGLFNRVFRARGDTREVFVKVFTDSAKDPSFPPLPTSGAERSNVAAVVNRLADTVTGDTRIRSARLLAFDQPRQAVVIESVPGVPLQTLLMDPASIDLAREIVLAIASWLRCFHNTARPAVREIIDAATRFKVYKSELQYYGMLEYLPAAVSSRALRFADSHVQNADSVILGDLNSRNVIVDFPQARIIDFEQGQVGDAAHDLAYVVSELVIADIARGSDPEADVLACWHRYRGQPGDPDDAGRESYRRHLAFQVLYRLKGPSRKTWSGHLPRPVHHDIILWCTNQFEALF